VSRITIDSISTIETNTCGTLGIKWINDVLLLSNRDSQGCITAISKDGVQYKNTFLKTGRGPGEVLYPPYISWLSFYNLDSPAPLMGIYDFKGNYYECDIEESLDNGVFVGGIIADSLASSSGERYFRIDSERLLCRKSSPSGKGFERHIISNRTKKRTVNASMEKLNSFASSYSNILSTIILINSKKDMIVELGSGLPVIHIYSISESYEKTLHIGECIGIPQMERIADNKRKRYYYDAKSYDEGFAGLFLDCTYEELDEGSYPNPEIHLFKWTGELDAIIQLPIKTLCFDIDLEKQTVYLVDEINDKILECRWRS
jgi:hypothetical protein